MKMIHYVSHGCYVIAMILLLYPSFKKHIRGSGFQVGFGA